MIFFIITVMSRKEEKIKRSSINLLQFQIQAKTDYKTAKSKWKTKKKTFPDVPKKVGVSYIQNR